MGITAPEHLGHSSKLLSLTLTCLASRNFGGLFVVVVGWSCFLLPGTVHFLGRSSSGLGKCWGVRSSNKHLYLILQGQACIINDWQKLGGFGGVASSLSLSLSLSLSRLPRWLTGKEFTCQGGDPRNIGSIPGSERSPGGGNGNPLQYSCLENFMNGEAWWVTVHGVTESQRESQTWLSIYIHIYFTFHMKPAFLSTTSGWEIPPSYSSRHKVKAIEGKVTVTFDHSHCILLTIFLFKPKSSYWGKLLFLNLSRY